MPGLLVDPALSAGFRLPEQAPAYAPQQFQEQALTLPLLAAENAYERGSAASFREQIAEPVRLTPREPALVHQLSTPLNPENLHYALPGSNLDLAITDSGDNHGAAAASGPQAIEDLYTAIDRIEEVPVSLMGDLSIRLRVPARQLEELRAAGWDETALGRWLGEGLRIQLEQRDGAITSQQLQDFIAENPSIFFALVDTSSHLWEHHVDHGGIFMNRALLELKERSADDPKAHAVADAHLASGFSHELVHRIRREGVPIEAELVAGDVAVVTSVLAGQGIMTHRNYFSLLSGLLHDTASVFYARQLGWAVRLVQAELAREAAQAKMVAVGRMEAEQAARRDQIAEQIPRLLEEAEQIRRASPAIASMKDRSRQTLVAELAKMDRQLDSLPKVGTEEILAIERFPRLIRARQQDLTGQWLESLQSDPSTTPPAEASQISTPLEVDHRNFGTGPPHLAFVVTKTGNKRGDVLAKGAQAIERYYTDRMGLESIPVTLMDGVAIQLRIPALHLIELRKAGWSDAEMGRLLREGLHIRMEQRGVIDESQVRAFAEENPAIFFALVDTSTHLWEHHVGHGGIFMNRGLLRLRRRWSPQARKVADALFASGFSHELVHRIRRQGTLIEAELLPGDAAVVTQLLRRAGVSHRVLRPILTGFLQQVAIAFYVRQMVMASRLVRAEEAQRTGVTRRLQSLQAEVETLGSTVERNETVMEEQEALAELLAAQADRRGHLGLWIPRLQAFHAGAIHAKSERRAATWEAYLTSMHEELQSLDQELAAQSGRVAEARQSAGEAAAGPLVEAQRLVAEERRAIPERPGQIRHRQVTLVDDLLAGLERIDLAKRILRRVRRDHVVMSSQLDDLLGGYCVQALDQIARMGLAGTQPIIHSLNDVLGIYRYIDQQSQEYGGRASLVERFAEKGIDGISNVVSRYFFFYVIEHTTLSPEPPLQRIDITALPMSVRTEALRTLQVIYGDHYQMNPDHLRHMANYDIASLGYLCDLSVKQGLSIASLEELIYHYRLVDIAVRVQGDETPLAGRLARSRSGTDFLASPLLRLSKRKWDLEQAERIREETLARRKQTDRILRLILGREPDLEETEAGIATMGALYGPVLEHLTQRARNEGRSFASMDEAIARYQKVVPAIEKRVSGTSIQVMFEANPSSTKSALNREFDAASLPEMPSHEARAIALLHRIRGDDEVRTGEMRMIMSRIGMIEAMEVILTSAEASGEPVVLVSELMRIYNVLDSRSRELTGSLANLFTRSHRSGVAFVDHNLDKTRPMALTGFERNFASAEIAYRESRKFLDQGAREVQASNLGAAQLSYQKATAFAETAREGFLTIKPEDSDRGDAAFAGTIAQRAQTLGTELIPELQRRSGILEVLPILQRNRGFLDEGEAMRLSRFERGEAPAEQDLTDFKALSAQIDTRKVIRAALEILESGGEFETEVVVHHLLGAARALRNHPVELEVYGETFFAHFAERVREAAVAASFLLQFLPDGEDDSLLARQETPTLTAPDRFVLRLLNALTATVSTIGQLNDAKTRIDGERDQAHARMDIVLEAILDGDLRKLYPLYEDAGAAAERVRQQYRELGVRAAPMSPAMAADAGREAQRMEATLAGMDRDVRDLIRQKVDEILARGHSEPIPYTGKQQVFEEAVFRQEQRLLADPNNARLRVYAPLVRDAVVDHIVKRLQYAPGTKAQAPRIALAAPEAATPEEEEALLRAAYRRLGYIPKNPPTTERMIKDFWLRGEPKRMGLDYDAYLRLLRRRRFPAPEPHVAGVGGMSVIPGEAFGRFSESFEKHVVPWESAALAALNGVTALWMLARLGYGAHLPGVGILGAAGAYALAGLIISVAGFQLLHHAVYWLILSLAKVFDQTRLVGALQDRGPPRFGWAIFAIHARAMAWVGGASLLLAALATQGDSPQNLITILSLLYGVAHLYGHSQYNQSPYHRGIAILASA